MNATPIYVASSLIPLAMHAPDGLFSMQVNILFAALVVLLLGVAIRRLSERKDHRLPAVMGVMAAFVFAAQMVNFPVAAGTTGHLLGGTLAAILLGPWAGGVVMAAVVSFQALLGDGGITVLGPNIFNMGIVGTLAAYPVYRAIVGRRFDQPARVITAAFFAAWLAVVLASILVSLQLALSGTASLNRALPAMLFTHMAIGLGEALITSAVAAFIIKTRPDLLYGRDRSASFGGGRRLVAFGLGGSLIVALFLSLLPTLWDHPDGLEFVGAEKGFLFDQRARADDGSLAALAAYPLGVRLESRQGQVTAVHQYDERTGAVAIGDVVQTVDGKPTPDLGAVATALRFDPSSGAFGVRPGDSVGLTVNRGGRKVELTVRAVASPVAGVATPLVALLPDYRVPGIEGLAGTSLAGALGTLVMFVASFVVGKTLARPGRLERIFAGDSAGPERTMEDR